MNTNPIIHHADTQMQAQVVLASKAEGCPQITTVRMRYPRIIHAELMTHRVFSRNARSSRAVPVARMIEEIRNEPFVPWHWGKNQKGMQAGEECNETVRLQVRDYDNIQDDGTDELGREDAWLWARDKAVEAATAFMEAGYHKQIANRLLEPFMWIDVLVTSTAWDNFFWLRDHADAEPHLQDLSRIVKQAIDDSEVQKLEPGEWHLPYITAGDYQQLVMRDYSESNPEIVRSGELDGNDALRRISAARCARISYAPFDGDASYERELERYDSLVSSDRIHASPLEHQATPDTMSERYSAEGEYVGDDWDAPHRHGNFTGWIQFRKTVPGENYRA